MFKSIFKLFSKTETTPEIESVDTFLHTVDTIEMYHIVKVEDTYIICVGSDESNVYYIEVKKVQGGDNKAPRFYTSDFTFFVTREFLKSLKVHNTTKRIDPKTAYTEKETGYVVVSAETVKE